LIKVHIVIFFMLVTIYQQFEMSLDMKSHTKDKTSDICVTGTETKIPVCEN